MESEPTSPVFQSSGFGGWVPVPSFLCLPDPLLSCEAHLETLTSVLSVNVGRYGCRYLGPKQNTCIHNPAKQIVIDIR